MPMTCEGVIGAMMLAGCAGLAYFIWSAATYEPPPVPPVRLGDPSTYRREKIEDGIAGHFFGVLGCCFVIGYALSHPLCG